MKFYEIDFLEAGEKSSGDAIALRYRDDNGRDHVHVVDGGYTADGPKLVDHIKKYYGSPTLIEHVVLTHPDGDHAAGLPSVLKEFEVGVLWMNRPWNHLEALLPRFEYDYTVEGLKRRLKKDFPHTAGLEQIADEQGIEIRDAFQGNEVGPFTILAPSLGRYLDLIVESDKTPEPQRVAARDGGLFERMKVVLKRIAAVWGQESLKGESEGTSPENESSIVQYAKMCERQILLTGDAGVEALYEAHAYATGIGVDLSTPIKHFNVPHHGSRRNLSSDVLDRWFGPKLAKEAEESRFTAVISANKNDEEHPRKAVVRALIHRGARVIQTEGQAICVLQNAPSRQGWGPIEPLGYPADQEE